MQPPQPPPGASPPGGQPSGYGGPPPGSQPPGYGGQPPGGPPPGGQPPGYGGQPPQQPSNGMGIASMIVGIASIPFCFCFGIGGLAGVVAVILGFLGKQKVDQGLATNRGMVKAGLITGFVGIGLAILYWILFVTTSTVDWSRFEN